MQKKVGIPRGLFYYKYFPLWKSFFEELGAELVVSDRTNRRILDDGVKSCVDEACLPVKLFHGHVINLKDRVDFLFIPRFTSISRNEYICPKFGGLPDMVRHTVKGLPSLIDTEINLRKSRRNAWKAVFEAGNCLGAGKSEIRHAFKKALKEYRNYRSRVQAGELPGDILEDLTGSMAHVRMGTGTGTSKERNPVLTVNTGAAGQLLKIAVIGHVYNLYDRYISMDLLKKLQSNGADIITVDMVEEGAINSKVVSLSKPMFWNFGRKALGSALHLIERQDLDGIIFVMSFGCGIDSFVCDMIERRVRRETEIPFIILTLDEHSGEAGLNTRVEAFIDMIRWRKMDETHVSASG